MGQTKKKAGHGKRKKVLPAVKILKLLFVSR